MPTVERRTYGRHLYKKAQLQLQIGFLSEKLLLFFHFIVIFSGNTQRNRKYSYSTPEYTSQHEQEQLIFILRSLIIWSYDISRYILSISGQTILHRSYIVS